MRIERIAVHSLASLRGEQQPLELTGPELGEAGIVAITGATGAGKSTLLDAVCLALFGQTPRLQGRDADPRELLSRGAGEGRASVDLVLDDDRRLRCEWAVHRAHGKAEGKLQPARRRVFDLATGELLADKILEAQGLVEEGLGLTFDQFTGVILLAQGQFARFLEADDRDRAELLERLTGTDLY
ncbi:MAG: AAA family ATPase, partial [Holophagales bacterium]|nr:AAA family ATPase [Holophagales bacterium]